MVPGPTPTPAEVAVAGALPLVDERIPRFAELFQRVTDNLRRVLRTLADVLTFTSSTTGAFEGALQNLFSPGERVLVADNGFFAHRWVRMARRLGLDVVELASEWGERTDMDRLGSMLAADPSIRGAVCVHCETSTGVVNDMAAFGAAARGVITLVDAASSLGACELRTDDWGLDVVVSGSQKALMTPPGLAFASVSERAWAAHARSTTPRFYFDWTEARDAYVNDARTPWTPAIGLIVQLDVALGQILAEGLDAVMERHVRLGRAARAGLRALGFDLMVPDDDASAAVTTARVPEGVDAGELLARVLDEHGLQLTGGNGHLAGRLLRIGHCGHVDGLDVLATLAAIEMALASMGLPAHAGTAVAAAQRELTRERARA